MVLHFAGTFSDQYTNDFFFPLGFGEGSHYSEVSLSDFPELLSGQRSHGHRLQRVPESVLPKNR